jgi:hypothetical protein
MTAVPAGNRAVEKAVAVGDVAGPTHGYSAAFVGAAVVALAGGAAALLLCSTRSG